MLHFLSHVLYFGYYPTESSKPTAGQQCGSVSMLLCNKVTGFQRGTAFKHIQVSSSYDKNTMTRCWKFLDTTYYLTFNLISDSISCILCFTMLCEVTGFYVSFFFHAHVCSGLKIMTEDFCGFT
jgi:hypothetical protein